MWTLSQKSMPDWLCLPGMLRFFWERPEDTGGGVVRDGTECGKTCRLITLCADRCAVRPGKPSFTFTGGNLSCMARQRTLGLYTHTHTHLTCKRPLNDSCWSSQSPFSFTRLMNFSSPPFSFLFFYLFCSLLYLALMEGTGGRAG